MSFAGIANRWPRATLSREQFNFRMERIPKPKPGKFQWKKLGKFLLKKPERFLHSEFKEKDIYIYFNKSEKIAKKIVQCMSFRL